MRVVVDARVRTASGIGRYVTELVERVPALDPDSEFVVLVRSDDAWIPTTANTRTVTADWPIYSWSEQVRLPPLLRRLEPDVVHFPHINVPVAYRGARVVTVHDLTLLDHRNVLPGSRPSRTAAVAVKQRIMAAVVRRAVRPPGVVMTDSAFVADEVAGRFGIDRPTIAVTPIAVPRPIASAAPEPPLADDGRCLLYVGNLYPYKNVAALVSALARLGPRHGDVRLVLVSAQDEFAADIRRVASAAGVADRTTITGFVSDEELAKLYRGASAFVFPSLSEGFGLPGLEAMAHGVPVAAARASCLPEVYADAAAWFDPLDVDDVAAVIGGLLDDVGERARLIAAGGRRAASFSWDRTAAATLDAYRRATSAPATSGAGDASRRASPHPTGVRSSSPPAAPPRVAP